MALAVLDFVAFRHFLTDKTTYSAGRDWNQPRDPPLAAFGKAHPLQKTQRMGHPGLVRSQRVRHPPIPSPLPRQNVQWPVLNSYSSRTLHKAMPPSSEKTRHVDKGILLASFAGKVLGECPKCDGPVLITCQSTYVLPFVPTHARVNCLHCSFQMVPKGREWLGPVTGVAKGRCAHCGFKWLKKVIRRRSLKNRALELTSVACPSCEKVTKIQIKWSRKEFGAGAPFDPVLGLPLWLNVSCCGHSLWAYNGEHLSQLGAYVAAGLRERAANHHWSMFSRLPQWMTAGKNREAVLSAINRLNKKLASLKSKR